MIMFDSITCWLMIVALLFMGELRQPEGAERTGLPEWQQRPTIVTIFPF
jgi:hypothetical protein